MKTNEFYRNAAGITCPVGFTVSGPYFADEDECRICNTKVRTADDLSFVKVPVHLLEAVLPELSCNDVFISRIYTPGYPSSAIEEVFKDSSMPEFDTRFAYILCDAVPGGVKNLCAELEEMYREAEKPRYKTKVRRTKNVSRVLTGLEFASFLQRELLLRGIYAEFPVMTDDMESAYIKAQYRTPERFTAACKEAFGCEIGHAFLDCNARAADVSALYEEIAEAHAYEPPEISSVTVPRWKQEAVLDAVRKAGATVTHFFDERDGAPEGKSIICADLPKEDLEHLAGL